MTGDPFFWLADNIALWSRPVIVVLAGVVIGCFHLMAWALRG
jgi:hypothetical protein